MVARRTFPRRCAILGAALLLLGLTCALRAQVLEPEFSPETDAAITALIVEYVLYVALPAMFAVIIVLALLGFGSRGLPAKAGDDKGPQLPAGLRAVNVLGASYGLDTFSGTITAEKTITDQRIDVTVTGGTYGYGYWPWSATTSVTTTRTHVIWLRYPGGGDGVWTLTNSDFHVAPGQVVSFVARPTKLGKYECVFAYNHAGGQLERYSLFAAHRIAGLVSWLAATAVGAVVFNRLWVQLWATMIATLPPGNEWAAEVDPSTLYFIVAFTVLAAVVALLPYFVSLVVFVQLRERLFRARYQRGVREFLEASTAGLKQKLGS